MDKLRIKGIKQIEFLTKGKRGYVYTGIYKNKKVAIKIKNPDSKAESRIQNEIKFTKLLNKYKIAPKFLFADKKGSYLLQEYINGIFFPEFAEKNNKIKIKKVIVDVFKQCYILDQLKIDKEEMHNPYKHIIVAKQNKPFLIDFERCHYVIAGKNVTQFATYFISRFMENLLKKKKIKINRKKMISTAQIYKHCQTKENLYAIIKNIC